MVVHHVDLVYRPIHAFRYRWQGKEAVVEVDAVTGLARAGGSTFEHYVGKVLDAEFLLNAGVEMAGLFIRGARLAEIRHFEEPEGRQGETRSLIDLGLWWHRPTRR